MSMVSRSRIAALLGVGLLLIGEITARWTHTGLPSLAGTDATGPTCLPLPDTPTPEPAWTLEFLGEDNDPIQLVVAGDSMALGVGVTPEQTFAGQIAKVLAQKKERTVQVTNLSVNGGDACDSAGRLMAWSRTNTPDLAIWALFADDETRHIGEQTNGTLRLDPSRLPQPMARALLTSSALANWIWWQAAMYTRHSSPASANSSVSLPLPTWQEWKEVQPGALTTLLLGATGMALCPTVRPDSATQEECAYLIEGGARIAGALQTFGEPFLDLRELWNTDVSHVQAAELSAMEENQRLPIHPKESGHLQIATQVLAEWGF